MNEVPIDLPPISRTPLNGDQIRALLDDLEDSADVQFVQVARCGASDQAQAVSLATAAIEIRNRNVARLLIRYRYDEKQWCDTLLFGDGTCELVRIQT